ncbi:uncharacterized protein LOC109851263 isoform X1 [Asparagus officinalis]|nr:uncharacterized protein LOC109851263 isoform X1 [Asparagus officinalis]
MEILGSEGELSSGYKLVPWSSWDQWHFVRESLFSSSPDSVAKALQRISAWRSRGCLPVPIDVTAAIVEIQQKDPFFREGISSDALNSEELLAMLYSMAIMRLVNCFVEPAHKKTGRSISELADVVGIPRMLVDIRHESSHRNLPSLRLVRMASTKALDWLKSNYWEPQRSVIPDVRKEVRLRLHEMSFYLKNKHAERSSSSQGKPKRCKRSGVLMRCNKLSSQLVGKLQASNSDVSDKRLSKITKRITRLYSSYPSEVVAVLLEYFHLQVPDFSKGTNMECSDDLNVDDSGPHLETVFGLKTIITKLSSKTPGLILSLLKTLLEMIEAKESTQSEKDGCCFLSSKHQSEIADTNRLCSLVHWLLMRLKSLKDSGRIGIIGKSLETSTDKHASPNVSLTKLLHKVLSQSIVDDNHLSSSVLLLAQMIGNTSLTLKLKKLPLMATQHQDFEDESPFESSLKKLPLMATQHQDFEDESPFESSEKMLLREEACVKQAKEKLELFKSQLRNRNATNSTKSNASDRMWSVAKSWTPCPIGMVPCSFSSTAVLPVVDEVDDTLDPEDIETDTGNFVNGRVSPKRVSGEAAVDSGSGSKRQRMTREEQELDFAEISSPMKDRLLINGIWTKVSEEELLDIESNIRIFVN